MEPPAQPTQASHRARAKGLQDPIVALARTIAKQTGPTNRELIRVVAWYWDFVVVAWVAVYATIWLFTNH